MEKIKEYIKADTPCIWINTHEYSRCLKILNDILKDDIKKLRIWSITKGIYNPDGELNENEKAAVEVISQKVYEEMLLPLEFALHEDISNTVIALLDFHRFIDNPYTIRKLLDAIENVNFNQIVIISPKPDIPVEIEKYVTLIELPLPSVEELEKKLLEIIESTYVDDDFKNRLKNDELYRKNLANAGRGLTLLEFEEAVALSLKNKNFIDINDIFEQKKQLVKKNSALEILDPKDIDEVKGLDRAKEYITKAIKSGIGKGSLLVGIPGTGKSLLAKQIGKLTGLPTVVLNIGQIFGSLLGESESKINNALKTIEAMAPCILFIDEIDKGLAGVLSSNKTDGGTTARVFGKILTWLNDKNTGVYVIATANDISNLPPEFIRSGRWNWIFFVDFPSKEEREEILKYYCEKYGVPYEEINTEGYTGAEIKALVENAYILNCSLKEALEAIVPIYHTRKEEIEELRKNARRKFIPASYSKEHKNHKRKRLINNV